MEICKYMFIHRLTILRCVEQFAQRHKVVCIVAWVPWFVSLQHIYFLCFDHILKWELCSTLLEPLKAKAIGKDLLYVLCILNSKSLILYQQEIILHGISNVITFDLKEDSLFDWCTDISLARRSLTDNAQSNLPITARLFCSGLAVIGIQREPIRRNKQKPHHPTLCLALWLFLPLSLCDPYLLQWQSRLH